MYVSAKLTSWKARQYQFNRMVFFLLEFTQKGNMCWHFRNVHLNTQGQYIQCGKWKSIKKKKKASEWSNKGNSGFHKGHFRRPHLFCLKHFKCFSTRILLPSEWLHFCYHHYPNMNHGQPKTKNMGQDSNQQHGVLQSKAIQWGFRENIHLRVFLLFYTVLTHLLQ